MVISFNPIIFQNLDDATQKALAKILIILMEKNIHFIDIQSAQNIFFDEQNNYCFDHNNIALHYLSPYQKQFLKDYLGQKLRTPITKLHKTYLTKVVIGNDESKKELPPESAERLLLERSKIVVENGINDWKFIEGLCKKYTNHKIRGTIYSMIKRAIYNGDIEAENAGGEGEIIKIVQKWINSLRFKNIVQYKLMAIFDSDRTIDMGIVKETPHKSKIAFFKRKARLVSIQPADYEYDEKNDLIPWHILHKRKIENYMPLKVLFANVITISESQRAYLQTISSVELDYIGYEHKIGLQERHIKENFPQMFLDAPFSYQDIEERCMHHKKFSLQADEEISEIEQILLKIAKII